MFNFGPSSALMQRLGMMRGNMSQMPMEPEGPPPMIGRMPEGMPMPGGDMPIDVGGGVKFPGMELPPMGGPRMPRIIDGPMLGMPPGIQPPMNPGPMQPPPQQGGGFFGKIRDAAKRVAGGQQNQPQGKMGLAARFKNMSAAAAPQAARMLTGKQRGY